MIRINPVNSVNLTRTQKQQGFCSNPSERQTEQTAAMPVAQPDFAVKTPMVYNKIGDLKLPFDTKAHLYKLANGQRVVIIPKEGSTVVKTYVNCGSMNEPDKVRGISHYIEHNLFNGSDGLEEGDFFKVVNKMGADTNASTGFAMTDYYIKSHLLNDGDLEQKIKIHASMLETPFFKQEKLNKEKGIVNSEINMILGRPENIAVNKTLKNLYNIKSTSVDMVGGTTDNITNLSREDVVDYYNKNYYPANMTTVITGEVEPDETIKLISKYFHSDRKPPQATVHEELKPIQKTVREDIISDKASATSIIIGFNGPANNSVKEKVYLDALESLLAGSRTSRIDSKLKRFNTAAWMSEEKISTKPTDGRAVTIAVETTEENSEKVLKTVFNEVRGLQLNPPTGEEMQIIKKQMIKNLSSVFEQSFTTNSAIGNAFMDNSPEWLNDYEKIVNSMTANDLVEFSKKYLDLNKAAITVVHPSGSDVRSISQNYAAAVSFSGKTAKKQALDVEKVTEYQFANNVRLVINDIPTRNSRMSVQLKCKKKFEAQPAAYFVLDRMLNEGCAAKTEQEFAKELQKDGISQYFSSGSKDISAQSSFDVTDTAKALQAFKEVLYNPRFKEDAFVQAKNDIKEELLMSEKSVDKNINRELFKGTIAGYSNNEILESLNTLTMQEVEDLYSHIINNAQAKVVISAPLSKQPELFNTIVSELNLMKPAQPGEFIRGGKFKPVEETKVITESDNKNQANIIQAYKFEINHNLKDAVTVELLSTILGGGPSSRLFNDLREQQKLAYRVRSGGSLNGRTGTIKLAIGTTTENFDTGEVSYDNVQKSIEGFKKHINKLINEKVTGEELQNAKLSMKNDILSGNESTSGKTHALLKGMTTIYGISRENQKLEIIDQITADDIQNAAKYIFSGKPTYSIVATENTLKHNEEYLNLLKKPGI